MLLTDVIDIDDLEEEITAGYINRRFHPEFPELALVGYSEQAQYKNYWTPTVKACRGLIYNTSTLEVLARPFAKFFNFGQEDVLYDLDAPLFHVGDKYDGSLGIAYVRPDGSWSIATRGSFDSDQARHANALIAADLAHVTLLERMSDGGTHTPLVEIIYRENRIVLDYGNIDRIVPLGAVSIDTGDYLPTAGEGVHTFGCLRDVLEAEPRPNSEGFVVWLDPLTAVKLKQDDYIALHRIVSSLSRKEVWRQLRAETFNAFALALPDEFHTWAATESASLTAEFDAVAGDADRALHAVQANTAEDRKSQAIWLNENISASIRGLVFGLLDGKPIADSIWRQLEPSGVEMPEATKVFAP